MGFDEIPSFVKSTSDSRTKEIHHDSMPIAKDTVHQFNNFPDCKQRKVSSANWLANSSSQLILIENQPSDLQVQRHLRAQPVITAFQTHRSQRGMKLRSFHGLDYIHRILNMIRGQSRHSTPRMSRRSWMTSRIYHCGSVTLNIILRKSSTSLILWRCYSKLNGWRSALASTWYGMRYRKEVVGIGSLKDVCSSVTPYRMIP